MSSTLQFQKPNLLNFLRFSLLVSTLIGATAIWQFQAQITAEGLIVTSLNFRVGLYAGYAFVGVLALLAVLAWTRFADPLLDLFGAIQKRLQAIRPFALILFLLLLIVFPFIVLDFYVRFLLNPFPRLFLYLIFSLIGAA